MISCREVSTLVSTDGLGAQPLWRRLAVRLHLMMCAGCRRFASQIRAIRQGADAAGQTFDREADGIEARAARAMGRRDGL